MRHLTKTTAANCLAAFFIISGAVVLVSAVRAQRVNIVSTPPVPTTQPSSAETTTGQIVPAGSLYGIPVSISVPSVNVNISVIPGYYSAKTGEWTLTRTHAQYATITPEANTVSGNTFIYGHALNSVFGPLLKLKAGAEAVVQTSNGHTFYYTLRSTQVVSPDDSAAVLTASATPHLTLQTCTGLLYQNRALFTFDLERAV